jgi:hypothetical protein
MNSKRFSWIAGALGLIASLCVAPSVVAMEGLGSDWTPVAVERLDAMRGGYVSPSGLIASFGIERLVLVNGETITSTRLHVPDIGRLTTEQAQALAAMNQTRIVRVGGETSIVPGSSGGLVIQNALDGQNISALTTINASVNTLGLFQNLNLGSALDAALVQSSYQP